MKKDEIPTPGGVVTYWAVDACLAMDISDEDWEEDCKEINRIMLENFKNAKGDKDGGSS